MYPPLKGFPAIFFLSAYEKFDPIQYQGDRSFKSVKDWINRHSSIFLTEEERTGQAAEEDEEIESFTSENFEDDLREKTEEELAAEAAEAAKTETEAAPETATDKPETEETTPPTETKKEEL